MKRITQFSLASAALPALGLAAMAAQGAMRSYYANDPVGRNVVTIESRAPLETMLTYTNKVTGEIKINPDNVLDNPQARFELDLASLDTGIDMRNEHMRGESWLNTAKYPKAVFTLQRIAVNQPSIANRPPTLDDSQTTALVAIGEMEMRGIKRPVQARVEVQRIKASEDTAKRLPGELIHVRATFPIKLDEFGITMPAGSQLKVANEQQVTADIFTSSESTAPGTPPKPATDRPAGGTTGTATGRNMTADANQLVKEDLVVGTGAEAKAGDLVTVHYRGTLTNGTKFDASYDRNQPFSFPLGAGRVIRGWDEGVAGMKVGGKRRLTIPPALAYGREGRPPVIPGNSTLIFEVELLKVGR